MPRPRYRCRDCGTPSHAAEVCEGCPATGSRARAVHLATHTPQMASVCLRLDRRLHAIGAGPSVAWEIIELASSFNRDPIALIDWLTVES